MADRLNTYPRVPPHPNSNILQQQQHPQQSQQQSQSDPHSLQGIPNTDHSRMWSAAQQYRGQNSSEMATSQGNQQMVEFLRNQNFARMQRNQQQQQQQQQFGLGSSQMNAAGQLSSFHDQQGNQQNPAQQAPANFGNVGMPNSTQFQGNLNTRIPALGSTSISRQIELLGMAQNQLHQNPQIVPPNFPTRMSQQQQQQAGMNGQSGQNQGQPLFASQSADMNRGSPPHPTQSMPLQQGGMQVTQGMPAGRRPMTPAELKERANLLQVYVRKLESMFVDLNNNQASMDHTTFMTQRKKVVDELSIKKDALAKIVQAMHAMASQAQNNGNPNGSQGGNPGNMPAVGSSPVPQHQQAGPSGGNQSAWLSQPTSTPFQMRGVQLPSRGPSQPQNPQTVPQTHTPSQIQQSNLLPQRPGSTSRQLSAQISPSLSNQFPGNQFSAIPNPAQFTLPPPLDKTKFQESYAAFCASRSIVYDERVMSVDNRPIDLHALHHYVLSEGGATVVTQRDLWTVIGARMGFVQFPGTDTEPDKSGPGVAQQLQHLYKEYLAQFDQLYVHSALSKKNFPGANSTGTPQANNPTAGNTGGNMPGPGQLNMMNAVMVYANTSVADMRSRGVPDGLIKFVEQNRPRLQQTLQQQQSFRGMVQKPNASGGSGQTSEPERVMPNVSGFPFISTQQQQAISSAARPPPQPPQQGQPQVGMNLAGVGHGQPQPQNPMIHSQPCWPARPSQEQSQYSFQLINKFKQDFLSKTLPNMKQHPVPENQRMDYLKTLEQAYRYAQEIEPKLPMFYYVLRDAEMIRKMVAIIYTTREQRNLLSNTTSPKYILPFHMLSSLMMQVQNANAQLNAAVSPYGQQASALHHPGNGQPPSNGSQQRPPIPQGPQHIQPTPSIPTPSVPPLAGSRPVNLHQPPPSKKKLQQPVNTVQNTAAAAAPSPTPPASTPAAAATPAATPAAASPKTPKSPKGKASAKPKASASTKRKSSKVVPPTPEPAQPTAPSPAGSLKRQREEEETTVDTPAVPSNAPSPKKVKTESEWEGPPNEEVVKKEQQVENIKTEEDASAFLEQMTELIKLAAGNDQESLTSDISETLDMILKGCGQDYGDIPGASSSMAPLGFGDTLGLQDPSLPPHADEFQDFLDFTSCAADDIDSKPTTPDLVSSSSTNPSPESASDAADAGHSTTAFSSDGAKSANFKSEDMEGVDPYRLGGLGEIDGGQTEYHQSQSWSWEKMPAQTRSPWAIG